MPGYLPKPPFPRLNASHPIANGVVGAWLFYEGIGNTVHDLAENPNDGTAVSAIWSNSYFGNAGQFLHLTNNDFNTNYRGNLTDFTCVSWFFGSGQNNAYERICDKDFQNGFWLGRNASNPSSFGGGILQGTFPYGLFISLSELEWHQIVQRRIGTTQHVIGDGFQVSATQACSGTAFDSTAFRIGDDSTAASPFFGNIDSVILWNRGLSDDEIRALYFDPYLIFRFPHFSTVSALQPLQRLHPNADSVDGGWLNEVRSAVNLYASIDEDGAANDADFIQSSDSPSHDIVTIALSDPAAGATVPFNIIYRYGTPPGSVGSITLVARLKCGSTVIKSWTHTDATPTMKTVVQSLTSGEVASIADFTNLFIEFEATY